MARLDVLVPTCQRAAALAVTLAGLVAQEFRDFRVVVSDQTEDDDPFRRGEMLTAVHVLRMRGREVELHRHLPRRGLAEQRQFLLDQARAPCVVFLDDDLILEARGGLGSRAQLPQEHCGEDVLAQLRVMERYGGCGLIPSGVYHQELPTTVADRRTDARHHLPVELPA
jgi:glycosyltransferase involved in cell wall biosynthesis